MAVRFPLLVSSVNSGSGSSILRSVWWCGAAGLAILALIYPALYNGFPLVFYDTGGYIARAFEPELVPGRSVAYGNLLWILELGLAYWPTIVVQSGVVLWLIHVCARVHDLPHGPLSLAATTAGLAISTGLPWFTAQLMPDIWASVLILALYLLGFRSHWLTRWEKGALAACAIFAMASHMSHVALGIGLVVVIVAFRCFRRNVTARLPVLILVLGIGIVPTANWLAAGQFKFTPGGQTFIFSRLVQEGIIARFLADHCPSPEYRLCNFRDRLPTTADDWIWHSKSPFQAIGGWEGGAPEMARIIRESLTAYPVEHLVSALGSTWEQLIKLRTGDGIDRGLWHVRYTLEQYQPDLLPAFDAARQQSSGFTFTALNLIHVPVAQVAVVVLALLSWRLTRRESDLAVLGAFILIALVGNAFICGALSNPHDRYQSRIVWLAVLCVILVGQRLLLITTQAGITRMPVSRCSNLPVHRGSSSAEKCSTSLSTDIANCPFVDKGMIGMTRQPAKSHLSILCIGPACW
jgi:hypothetical protein